MGLLLLRTAAGLILISQGVYALVNTADSTLSNWMMILIAVASGVSVLLGFLTPIGSVLAAMFSGGIALSWLPQWLPDLASPRQAAALVAVIATALAFLGPGGFSVDSRLFGRREIVIPQVSRSTKV